VPSSCDERKAARIQLSTLRRCSTTFATTPTEPALSRRSAPVHSGRDSPWSRPESTTRPSRKGITADATNATVPHAAADSDSPSWPRATHTR